MTIEEFWDLKPADIIQHKNGATYVISYPFKFNCVFAMCIYSENADIGFGIDYIIYLSERFKLTKL